MCNQQHFSSYYLIFVFLYIFFLFCLIQNFVFFFFTSVRVDFVVFLFFFPLMKTFFFPRPACCFFLFCRARIGETLGTIFSVFETTFRLPRKKRSPHELSNRKEKEEQQKKSLASLVIVDHSENPKNTHTLFFFLF